MQKKRYGCVVPIWSRTSVSLMFPNGLGLQKDRATRMCCFSPCMEQVLRTVSALNEAGFTGLSLRLRNVT